jgi:hypothetical protein
MRDERAQFEAYEALGGNHVLIDIAVEVTGLVPGAVYEFDAIGGGAVCRWDTTSAAATDGAFTFAVTPGSSKRVKNPLGNTLLNVIQANSDSTATASLLITRVLPE